MTSVTDLEEERDVFTAIEATSRSLPIALLRAREKLMVEIRPVLQRAGVTEQQWRVLRVLKEGGVLEPSEIAEQSCLLLPSLTRILKHLETLCYIDRHPHATDKRRFLFSITPLGSSLIEKYAAENHRVIARLRDKLGQEKSQLLISLLQEVSTLELND